MALTLPVRKVRRLGWLTASSPSPPSFHRGTQTQTKGMRLGPLLPQACSSQGLGLTEVSEVKAMQGCEAGLISGPEHVLSTQLCPALAG